MSQTEFEKEIVDIGILSNSNMVQKESQTKVALVITGETERI
jgi:hypothetical protein